MQLVFSVLSFAVGFVLALSARREWMYMTAKFYSGQESSINKFFRLVVTSAVLILIGLFGIFMSGRMYGRNGASTKMSNSASAVENQKSGNHPDFLAEPELIKRRLIALASFKPIG